MAHNQDGYMDDFQDNDFNANSGDTITNVMTENTEL